MSTASVLEKAINRPVAAWLLACCALVFAMICIGGITRLTHSGLSIVEWQPIVGAIPPITEAHWLEMFEKYRRTPEYLQVNRGMSLEEFKGIFWWEYIHRLMGRLIGLAYFVPMVWFLWRGQIARQDIAKIFGIFVLGGLQGAMGWYMVASGLVDDPRVSHLRLTAHLGLAVLIYGAMLWMALNLLRRTDPDVTLGAEETKLGWFALAIASLIFLMILSGGLVAGIRAGYAYNTFPLMNGFIVPPEIMLLDPWYLNFVNNIATIQFNHRLLAFVIAGLVAYFWIRTRDQRAGGKLRVAALWLGVLLAIQIGLGIATLVLLVPVPLAALHQASAMLVFTVSIVVAHLSVRPTVQPARGSIPASRP